MEFEIKEFWSQTIKVGNAQSLNFGPGHLRLTTAFLDTLPAVTQKSNVQVYIETHKRHKNKHAFVSLSRQDPHTKTELYLSSEEQPAVGVWSEDYGVKVTLQGVIYRATDQEISSLYQQRKIVKQESEVPVHEKAEQQEQNVQIEEQKLLEDTRNMVAQLFGIQAVQQAQSVNIPNVRNQLQQLQQQKNKRKRF